MMSSNRRTEGKASVLSYEVVLLIGFQPSNGGCSWFPKIFGISLISEESMPKKRLQRKVCWEEVRKKFRPKFPPGGLSMPKPLEYIPWSPRNIFALNLIFYKYILFCLNKCLMRVVSTRNKLKAVEFWFFLSISWLNELLHHRAAQQVCFLWDNWRRWWRQWWLQGYWRRGL